MVLLHKHTHTHTRKQRPGDVLQMSHFDQWALFNLLWHIHVSAIFGSAESYPQHHTLENCFVGNTIFRLNLFHLLYDCAFCHCYTTTIITQKLTLISIICQESLALLLSPPAPTVFCFSNFTQLSHSVSTAISLVLSCVYQKTAPDVSLINDIRGWAWFITDLTHRLAHVWVILVLRGLLRGSSSKPP